jgi:hypothetical protein
MERHLSAGVATIVALMSAHRAAAGGVSAACFREDVTRIEAYLREEDMADRTSRDHDPDASTL